MRNHEKWQSESPTQLYLIVIDHDPGIPASNSPKLKNLLY
jgi:hypothetical protein